MLKWCILAVCIQLTLTQQYQKVAPGVNPQHYQQQQPPPPQYQQPPNPQAVPQHQQVPVQPQYQQPPPQQHQQQPPQQHQAQHAPHGQPHGDILNTANIQQEREHIQEHMEVPIDTSKMSEQELQFHYFKMHDSDNNNKLDGLELIKSLIHWHGQIKKEEERIYTDSEISEALEYFLDKTDANNDGYIDYVEFKTNEQLQQLSLKHS